MYTTTYIKLLTATCGHVQFSNNNNDDDDDNNFNMWPRDNNFQPDGITFFQQYAEKKNRQ